MILGYLLFTRNDLSLVVNVLLTKAFQPMFPVISSFFFSLSKKITLVEGLAATRFHRLAGNHPTSVSDFQHDAVGRLGQFIARVPFWQMQPAPDLVKQLPPGVSANVLAAPGGHYVAQLLGGAAGGNCA
jgi:hypothetical protein